MFIDKAFPNILTGNEIDLVIKCFTFWSSEKFTTYLLKAMKKSETVTFVVAIAAYTTVTFVRLL